MSEFKIAALAGGVAGLALLSALTAPVPDPVSFWRDYQEQTELGNLTVRGLGYPSADWLFPRLTVAERTQLKTFCAGASAVVYIRTLNHAGSYANYKAVLVWPQEERCRAGFFFETTLHLQRLEVQA